LRKIYLIIIFVEVLFGLDAKMEIIKTKSTLPTIIVSAVLDGSNSGITSKIKDLIQKDFQVSGHFKLSKQKIKYDSNDTFNVKYFRNENIDLLLKLHVRKLKNNLLDINIQLYDINKNEIVLNKIYSAVGYYNYPFMAHKISIEVNKYLNAPTLAWMDNLIVFSRYKNAKESEIVISDYTLTYQKIVVSGGLNIFPKWVNNTQESFYYTSYNEGIPTLKIYNLKTGKLYSITNSDGMIVCSDVSVKSSKIILTMAPNSQPDIYTYDIKSKIKERITNYSGIDVGGSFVENDKKIVFVSDRLKKPNIFAKTIGQKGVERLVYHGRNNSQCTTFQDYIVYSSRELKNEFGGSAFNLYLISTKSDFIRRLTSVGKNQFPKFSQDGNSLLFIKRYKGKSYLGIIRLNFNKSFLFSLKSGKLQSIDW